MKNNKIDIIFNSYIAKKTIPNGVLLVRKNDEIIYKGKWGFSNLETGKPIEYNSIFK